MNNALYNETLNRYGISLSYAGFTLNNWSLFLYRCGVIAKQIGSTKDAVVDMMTAEARVKFN